MIGKMEITYLDGSSSEGETRKSDAIRFERHFDTPISKAFGDDGMRVEYLWFFGWCVACRNGDARTFDEWVDVVDNVEIVEGAKARPTKPSRTRSQ